MKRTSFMRTTCISAALLGGLLFAQTGSAATVAEDNFDYATGNTNNLNGGTGWSGGWNNFFNDAQSQIVTPTTALTYTNAGANPIGGGNALQLVNNPPSAALNTAVVREFSGLDAGETFYIRFLIRMESGSWDSNDFLTSFVDGDEGTQSASHSPGPNAGLRGLNDAGNKDFFSRTGSSNYANSSMDFTSSTTYLVVARYEDANEDGEYDQTSIWVNPQVGDAGTPQGTSTIAQSYVSTASYAGFRFGSNLDSDDVFTIDALAITDDWNSALNVIPESNSSVMYLTVCLVLLGLSRFRTKRS